MPLPYRYLTSLMLRYNGRAILLDCGEGTQIAMKKKGWSPNPIDVMLFTHYHADHISGLPGMLLSMANSERTEPVLMVGPEGLEHVVSALRVIAADLPFEIQYRELHDAEETFDLPGDPYFHITAFKVRHRVTCYGYSFTLDRAGKFDAARAQALQIPVRCWGQLQKGEPVTLADARKAAEGRTKASGRSHSGDAQEQAVLAENEGTFFAGEDPCAILWTPEDVMGPPRKGLKVTYCTDTRPTQSIVQNALGADLFICEGMYGEEDKLDKARQKKHMTFQEAAEIGRKAQPRQMWLTHYSPSEMHPENYIGAIRNVFPRLYAGKDGKSTTLKFSSEE